MKLENLELIGIHIKKTGGMSFKNLLYQQYDHKYFRINLGPHKKNREDFIRQKIEEMPKDTRVIHGHFMYMDMAEIINSNPDVPVVTWLRDPVQRMVSYYYYAKNKFDNGLRKNKDFLADISLIDYASKKARKNVMTRILAGVDLADLTFVGLLEHVDEDIDYLSSILGWEKPEMPVENTNTSYKSKYPAPSEEELRMLAEFNQKDIELYNYAREIRESRMAAEKK